MPSSSMNRVADYLCKVASKHLAETMSDRELLERFIANRDEAAFAAVVHRHGPMVHAVTRRLLNQNADADDAFQATFLILLRRAGSIRRRESLSSWLHGVAHRVSARARKLAGRERLVNRTVRTKAITDDISERNVRELHQWLDRAVGELPECYRACFILCCMEGRSYAHAARLLGCAEGTVSSRVVRARERLRSSFNRSGLGASGCALTLEFARATSPVPQYLFDLALQFGRDDGVSAALTATKVGLLAKGVLDSMFIAKAKIVCAISLVLLAATGLTTKAYFGDRNHDSGDVPESGSNKAHQQNDFVNIPSRCEGILESLARADDSNKQKAQSAELLNLIKIVNRLIVKQADLATRFGPEHPEMKSVRSNIDEMKKLIARDSELAGKSTSGVRTLRVGDLVEKGDIIANIEDTVARVDTRIMESKKKFAEADLKSSEKTRDEAYQRWQTAKRLRDQNMKSMSLEDVRGAELTYNRYLYEAEAKQEAVNIAISDVEKAKVVLAEHQIRSGVRGIVRRIHKRPGEAVRKFETVLTLELLPEEN